MIKDIIISGPVGLRGAARLAQEERARLCRRYTPSYLGKAVQQWQEACACASIADAAGLMAVEEGGIYSALWELAEQEGCGFRLRLMDIPIRQETIEICNELDIDPYRLDSGACYLQFVEGGAAVLEEWKRLGWSRAALVGHTTGDKKRLLYYGDVERFLTPPEKSNTGGIKDAARGNTEKH